MAQSKIKIREFKTEDAIAIKDNLIENIWNGLTDNNIFKTLKDIGINYTAEYEDRVIACGGFFFNEVNIGTWTMYSSLSNKFLLGRVAIMAKRILDNYCLILRKNTAYREIRTLCRCENIEIQKYLEHLGFHKDKVVPSILGGLNYLYIREI